MNRRKMSAVITMLVLATVSMSACGDVTPVSMTSGEIIEESKAVEETTTVEETKAVEESVQSVAEVRAEESAPVVEVKAEEPAPEPVHVHEWKEHTVTEQVWVPNIVVVDDYQDIVHPDVPDVYICDCGYTTTDASDIENHIMTYTMAWVNGDKSAWGHGGFTIQCGHEGGVEEHVLVGRHEEDHGYYETVTRVDYYYCDCSATK